MYEEWYWVVVLASGQSDDRARGHGPAQLAIAWLWPVPFEDREYTGDQDSTVSVLAAMEVAEISMEQSAPVPERSPALRRW